MGEVVLLTLKKLCQLLDWVFPGEKGELTNLSENTSLQKSMKKFLLDGHKVGWAKGHFIKM